jgi:hypothetical protein
MPPASNQLFTYNDVAAEVAAGRMVWSGAAQSGNSPLTWSQYTSAVTTNGTNPQGYTSNQCVQYQHALAVAVTIMPPTSVTATDIGGGECDCSFTAPSSGLAPTSYDYQFFVGGVGDAVANTTTSPVTRAGYTNGQLAKCQVRSKNGSLVSGWVMSNTVTMAVGGA